MPDVPTYKPDRVALRPGPTGNLSGLGSDAFGGQIGQALGNVAGAVNDVAATQARRADMMDETAAKDLDVQYAAFERQTLWGDEKSPGFYAQRGRDVLNARPAVEQQLQDKARALIDTAKSPQQQAMFKSVLAARLQSSQGGIDRHATEAADQDFVATSSARMTLQAGYATSTWENPQEQATQIATGLHELTALADHAGWDPDTYALKKQEYLTGIHGNVVADIADRGDPVAARAYLSTHERDMDPGAVIKLKASLRELTDVYGAQAAVSAVLTTGATTVGGTHTGPEAQRVAGIVKAEGGSDAEVENMIAMDLIESGGKASPKNNGSSTGKYQFKPDTFASVAKPGEDINNPDDSTRAAFRLYRQNQKLAQRVLGRPAAPWELYLLHQQGSGGGPALLTAPRDMNAIQALLPAYPGHPYKARRAVLGNAPAGAGINENSTVGDFLDAWQGDVAKKLGVAAGGRTAPPAPPVGAALPDRAAFVSQVMALAPSDPRARAKFKAQAESAWSDMKQNQGERERAMEDQVQPVLRDPSVRTIAQFVAKVGPSGWAALPEKTKTTITEHYGSGGYAKESDPIVLAGLQQLQSINNGKAFADLDLTQYVGKLSAGNFASMLEAQKVIRTGGGPAKDQLVTQSRLMGVSESLLRAVRIDPNSKNPAVASRVAQFQGAMMEQAEAWKKMNPGKLLDDDAIHKMADTLLLSGTYTKDGAILETKALRFEVPRGRHFDYEVPKAAKQTIVTEFTQANRRKPTAAEVQELYRRHHARGRFQ